MGEDNPVLSAGEEVWKKGDLKIVKWYGGFILYDTNPSSHLTMREISDDPEENIQNIASLQEYARGYSRGKRMYQ